MLRIALRIALAGLGLLLLGIGLGLGWAHVGIRREKKNNSRRINSRAGTMIDEGLVDEVRGLLAEPAGLTEQARQALGYAEITEHLNGASSLEDAVERIKINTRRFAKHQRTWYRKFPMTDWVDVAVADSTERVVGQLHDRLTQ